MFRSGECDRFALKDYENCDGGDGERGGGLALDIGKGYTIKLAKHMVCSCKLVRVDVCVPSFPVNLIPIYDFIDQNEQKITRM